MKLSLGGGLSARVLKVLASRKTSMSLPRAFHCQTGTSNSDKQICGVETGETEKQNGSCAAERVRKRDMKTLRDRLILEACLPPGP